MNFPPPQEFPYVLIFYKPQFPEKVEVELYRHIYLPGLKKNSNQEIHQILKAHVLREEPIVLPIWQNLLASKYLLL